MKWRWTKIGLFFLLAVSCSLSLLFYTVQRDPELLINRYTVAWIANKVLDPIGVELRFASLSFGFERQSFWQRSVRIKTQDFSLRMHDFNLLISSFDGRLRFNMHPSDFAMEEIGPLQAKGVRFMMRQALEAPASIEDPNAEHELSVWRKMRWQGPLEVGMSFAEWSQGESLVRVGPIQLNLDTPKPHEFRLLLSSGAIKAKFPDGGLDLPGLKAEAGFFWDGQSFSPTQLGPLEAENINLELRLAAADNSKEEGDIDWNAWWKRIEGLKIEPLRLSFKKLLVQKEKQGPLQGALDLQVLRPDRQSWQLKLRGQKFVGVPFETLNLDLNTSFPETNLKIFRSDWQGKVILNDKGSIKLEGQLQRNDERFALKLGTILQNGGQHLALKMLGGLVNKDFTLDLLGDVRGLHEYAPNLSLSRCHLAGQWQAEQVNLLSSQLDCALRVDQWKIAQEANLPIPLPKSQDLAISGPLSLYRAHSKPSLKGQLRALIKPWQSEAYRTEGELIALFDGPIDGFAAQGKIQLDGGLRIAVNSFQRLVTVLRQTAWEVPAPLHTLDGPLSCKAGLRFDRNQHSFGIPIECQSQLASSMQYFQWTARGDLVSRDSAKPLLSLDIMLDRIQLELPKLTLGEALPQVLADKRFAPLEVLNLEEGKDSVIDWNVTIKNPEERPVRLVSDLLKEPVPLSVNLATNSEEKGVSGTISLQGYKLDLMKKKAMVELVGLRLEPHQESPELFGTLRFEDPDTKILLKLAGTVERPYYILESQPPRPPSELLSMVLFGGRSDAMSDDNLRSIEQTRAAMIDGAIGLVSMFYLASTPIDSVGYNPYSGVFRARVQLGQGTSLFVGSDLAGAKQSIGLRRRLTENWSFETGAETNEADGKNKGLAMFKWGRRY